MVIGVVFSQWNNVKIFFMDYLNDYILLTHECFTLVLNVIS